MKNKKVALSLAAFLVLPILPIKAEPFELSLSQARDMAVAESIGISVADYAIQAAQVSVDEASLQYDQLTRARVTLPTYENALIRRGYLLEDAKTNLEFAKLNKQKVINGAHYKTEMAYYTLINSNKAIEIAKISKQSAETNLDSVNKLLQAGKASEFDKTNAEFNVERAELNIRARERQFENDKLALTTLIGVDKETQFLLTDTLDITPMDNVNIEFAVARAMKERYDILNTESTIKKNKRDIDVYHSFFTPNTYNYMKFDLVNIRQLEETLNSTKQAIELSIRQTYNNCLTTQDNIEMAKTALSLAEINVKKASVQAENGLITNYALTTEMDKVTTCMYDVAMAELAFQRAKTEFYHQLGLGYN